MNPTLGWTLLALAPSVFLAFVCWIDDNWEAYWWTWTRFHAVLLVVFAFSTMIAWLIGA